MIDPTPKKRPVARRVPPQPMARDATAVRPPARETTVYGPMASDAIRARTPVRATNRREKAADLLRSGPFPQYHDHGHVVKEPDPTLADSLRKAIRRR